MRQKDLEGEWTGSWVVPTCFIPTYGNLGPALDHSVHNEAPTSGGVTRCWQELSNREEASSEPLVGWDKSLCSKVVHRDKDLAIDTEHCAEKRLQTVNTRRNVVRV
jgi:hypothetical protein